MEKRNLNYIYNLCYQILLVVIPLFLTPYLSRTLGVDAVGNFGYINSVVSIIVTVGLFGINTYGYREIALCTDDTEKMTKLFFEITIVRMFLMLISLICYIPFLFSDFSIFFLIMIFHIISQFLDVSWVFIGVENLKLVAIRNFVVKLISTILIFILVKSPSDLDVYIWILSLSSLFINIAIIFNLKKYINYKISFNEIKVKVLCSHLVNSIKLFLPQIGLVLFLYIDKIMLKFICGETYVAYYDYAEKIISIPLAMLTAMCTAYIPYMAKLTYNSETEQVGSLVNNLLDFSLIFSAPLCFGICGIAANFVAWYLPESFYQVANTIYFLCPMLLFNACINVFGNQYLTVKNRIKTLSISYFGALLVDIVLNLIFIKEFKDIGAALATCFGLLFALIVQLIEVNKTIKIVNLLEKLKCLIASVLMLGVIVVLNIFLPSNIIGTILLIIVGAIVYFILLIVLKHKNVIFYLKKIFNRL